MRRLSYRGRKSPLRAVALRIEGLEGRLLLSSDVLPTALTGFAVPGAIGRIVADPPVGPISLLSSVNPAGNGTAVTGPYTPAQIRHAYGVDQLTSYDGTGQTIAIIDAYDDPTIATDLTTFDQRFGLPAANFTKVTPPSQATPAYNSGWALEISLDVEWAHAIAPGAKILLVEDTDASYSSLLGGVAYAVQQGANQVSMSWGGGEGSNESSFDSYFEHPGVTFLASTGDSGGELNYPAVSPYVTSVGGTTVSLDAAGNKLSESAWSSGGGGTSVYVAEPSYQAGFLASTSRGTPDVSYNADLSSGVFVFDNGNLEGVGGTSCGAPQWAGLVALANQGLAANGKPSLGTGQVYGTNAVLYQLAGGSSYTNPNGDFFDVTTGNNTHPATIGYDLATGLGSPVANQLIPDLIGPTTPTPPATPPVTPTVGDSGFETVVEGNGGFAYNPAGSAWTFSGTYGNGSGVAGNNSPFTSGNPVAPQGTQVAFLQDNGSISQSIANWAAGSYTIAFDAAQRGNYGTSAEDFQVMVDGTSIGTLKPTGTSYQVYTTSSFAVTAGAHTIKFVGLDSVGGDNTALLDAVTVAVATTTPPVTPTVGDSGFETVVEGNGGFAYNPAGSAWTFSGTYGNGSGVAGNNSPFTSGNPVAPQGTQVAFLQDNGSISQSIANWAAGSYTIAFDAAQRGNYGTSAEDFQVMVDGTSIGTLKPTGTSYQVYTTSSFAVTAGAHTIKFVGLDSVGGDNTALLDAVTVAVATTTPPVTPTVGDSGFETVVEGNGGFAYNPAGSAWTFSGTYGNGSGVAGNNSPFTSGNPVAPEGSQVAFLQDTGSISQSISGWAAGNYTIAFDAAQRGNYGTSAENFEILVDGIVISTFQPTGTSYQAYKTATFTVAAGAHTIKFLGLDSAGGDNTALLDAVTVSTA